jgi:Fe-S-cluster containining protein
MEREGFNFSFNPSACDSCDAQCCSGESGEILFSKTELSAISDYLQISTNEFLQNYCRKEGYRYSIKELKIGGQYLCIFLEKNRCQIYPVRPTQCRTFPFWDRFSGSTDLKELKRECIGVEELTKL